MMSPRMRVYATIVLSGWLLSACGSDDKPTGDSTPPDAIADLIIATVSDTSQTLNWTAPGDDGDEGTAAMYDVRYATSTITDANWDAATQVTGEPAPQAAGSAETYEVVIPGVVMSATVAGLEAEETYYFAIRTADEAENWSALSNIASGTLADGTPPAAVMDLSVFSATDTSVTLRWTAPGDDGNEGTASEFDLRYALATLTEGNWDAAIQLAGEPTPQVAGSVHSYTVHGLDADTTYYFALKARDEESNWSGLSNVIAGSPVQNVAVAVPDTGLESILRTALNQPTGDLMSLDLAKLTTLDAREHGITDLTGIEYCTKMSYLILSENSLSDLAPLAGLPGLQSLLLNDNEIVDLAPLSGLTGLHDLILWHNQIQNLGPLSGLTQLRTLNVLGNPVTSIAPLANLSELRDLTVSETGVTNIAAVANMTNLTDLNIAGNAISSLVPLTNLTHLRVLHISETTTSDLAPLAGLVNMQELYADNNGIASLAHLSAMIDLEVLHMQANNVSTVTPLLSLTKLHDLNLNNNAIVDLGALASLTALERLYLSSNPIIDLMPLVDNSGLGAGDQLWVQNCPSLSSASRNTHIPTLEGRGVTVHQ